MISEQKRIGLLIKAAVTGNAESGKLTADSEIKRSILKRFRVLSAFNYRIRSDGFNYYGGRLSPSCVQLRLK